MVFQGRLRFLRACGAFALLVASMATYSPHVSADALPEKDWERLASGEIDSLVTHSVADDGEVFIAGWFSNVKDRPASGIARWDGTRWVALGTLAGQHLGIEAMAWDGARGRLYVAGYFTTIGGVAAEGIAMWDGARWSALRGDVPNPVYGGPNSIRSLAIDPATGHLYAGGQFGSIEGVAVKGIARWNGSQWTALGAGIDGYGYVNSIAWSPSDQRLYVSGSFDRIDGGLRAENLAYWNGASWTGLASDAFALGPGTLAVSPTTGRVYLGGTHRPDNAENTIGVLQWDGTTWSTVGDGRPQAAGWSFGGQLAVDPVAGRLYSTITYETQYTTLQVWNGATWQIVAGDDQREMSSVTWDASANRLIVTGLFRDIAGTLANNVAALQADRWTAFDPGTSGDVNDVVRDPVTGDVYVGGTFLTIDGVPAARVARWDGTQWRALGGGVGSGASDAVTSLAWDPVGRRLYAAGRFSVAGGNVAANIALWDGSSWSAVGQGLRADSDLVVADIALNASGTRLVVVGQFDDAGDVGVSNVAQWDGVRWSRLQSGIDGLGRVVTFHPTDGSVFVGGDFATAGGVTSPGLAMWDGAAWRAIDNAPSQVQALDWDTHSGTLLAAKPAPDYTFNDEPRTPVARWSPGTRTWTPVGNGSIGTPTLLKALPNGGVLIGGSLRLAESTLLPGDGAHLWDGCRWRGVVRGSGSQLDQGDWNPANRTLLAVGRLGALDRAPMRVGRLALGANTEPSLTRIASGPLATVEDALPLALAPLALLCDLEGNAPGSVVVQVLGTPFAGERLQLADGASDIGDVAASFDPATSTLTLRSPSSTASLAQWQQAVRRVTYVNTGEVPATLARTLRFVANEGGLASVPMEVPLTVAPFNDAPVPTAPASLRVTEDVATPLSGFDFSDVDAETLMSLLFKAERGSVTIDAHPGISRSNSYEGAYMSGTLDDLRSALAAGRVKFRTDPDDVRDVQLTFTARDTGLAGITPRATAAGVLTRTLTVEPVDDPPTLTVYSSFLSYTEGSAPVDIGASAAITDVDSAIGICAAVISEGGQRATDRLSAATPGARWDAATLRLDLAPADGTTMTAPQCSAALATVSFATEGRAVVSGNRALRFVAGLGAITASAPAATIGVREVDDPAEITPAQRVVDGTEDTPLPLPGFTVVEPDSARLRLVVQSPTGSWAVQGNTAGLTVVSNPWNASVEGDAAIVIAFASASGFVHTPRADANGDVEAIISVAGVSATGGVSGTAATVRWTLRLAPVQDAPRFGAVPWISGVPRPRETLSIENDGASDPDGDTVETRWQWLRDGVEIAGATDFRYVVTDADVGRRVNARISVSDGTREAVALADPVTVIDSAALAARPDRAWIAENGPAATIAVLANDVFSTSAIAGGRLTITSSPSPGTASIVPGPLAGPVDDVIRYAPATSWSGTDRLRYQLCEGPASGRCAVGELVVNVGPAFGSPGPLRLEVPTSSGYRDVVANGLRPLPNVLFSASPLRPPQGWTTSPSPDLTPETPWDRAMEGSAFLARRIAASASPVAQHLVVEAAGYGGDVDLYVGVDANNDGQPSSVEVECAASVTSAAERCDLRLAATPNLPLNYWILVHNRSGVRQTIGTSWAEVPLADGDGTLVTTAPGNVPAGATAAVRLQWNDPTLLDRERRWGAIRMIVDGVTQAVIPVEVKRTEPISTPIALADGVPRVVRTAGAGTINHAFIDVPAGATQLRVTTQAAANVDLSLVASPVPRAEASVPTVPQAPATTPAGLSQGPSGNELGVISNPAPGRWYAVVTNRASSAADVTLLATVTASAPRVRPGGYYNPARSGSGLFVYPAGAAWAGLWYTYLQDGTPTWYYLQETAPGSNGIWRGILFRSAWFGTRNQLTAIGHATITPNSASAFTLTYTLDGEVGTEAYESFGGGCPTFAGAPLDASGHWFDPARAGSGYSVQLFPNYEFYTVFGYDSRGVPRYLIAERSGIGAGTETLTLDQNTGACPLCSRNGAPVRSRIGTFTRTFGGGTLQRIQLNGVYTFGVPGTWAANDAVIPLGSLQGCAAN